MGGWSAHFGFMSLMIHVLMAHLVNCDNFMNITLREVYQTSSEGDRFWRLKECYIRGSTVGAARSFFYPSSADARG